MESLPHIVIFPFMSKGHTIPLLHLTRLFRLHRHLAITIFTTPANRLFIVESLSDISDDEISIVSLPFPSNIADIPPGIESTDKLPSMSLFFPFINSTKLIQPHFEDSLKNISHVNLIISDGFLNWTLQSANKFKIPRVVFNAMNYYSMVLLKVIGNNKLYSGPELDNEPIAIPDFPCLKLTRNDMTYPFNKRDLTGPEFDCIIEIMIATQSSSGLIVNSFYELETFFIDHYNANYTPRAWSVGPLCLTKSVKNSTLFGPPEFISFMDQKLEEGISVLYIAFGTQAEVSSDQLKEITIGLERSEVSFLWVVRPKPEQEEIIDGFAERMKGKGLVVKDWVDQKAVLGHEVIKGFLSHCGWNSVIESLCACVPILAWPMMAEQHLNARMVVEEIEIGIRVETCDGSVRGFVKAEGLEKSVRELMEGEMGKLVRKRAKEHGEAARKAIDKGGSSWLALESFLDEFHINGHKRLM